VGVVGLLFQPLVIPAAHSPKASSSSSINAPPASAAPA
jgi:hypothetical protein